MKRLLLTVAFLCLCVGPAAAEQASLPVQIVEIEDNWKAGDSAQWIAEDTIGFIAWRRKEANAAMEYAFMTASPSKPASFMFSVSGGAFCRDTDGTYVFFRRKDAQGAEQEPGAVRWSPQNPKETKEESIESLTLCQYRRGALNRSLEALIGRPESMDMDDKTAVGVFKTAEGKKMIHYALDGKILGEWPIRNISSYTVSYQKGVDSYIVYASQPGQHDHPTLWDDNKTILPVYILNKKRSFEERHIPIEEWNRRGAFSLALTQKGLIASVLSLWSEKDGWRKVQPESGLYHEAKEWQQIRKAYVVGDKPRVADDGCSVLWVERRLDSNFKEIKPAIFDIRKAMMCLD